MHMCPHNGSPQPLVPRAQTQLVKMGQNTLGTRMLFSYVKPDLNVKRSSKFLLIIVEVLLRSVTIRMRHPQSVKRSIVKCLYWRAERLLTKPFVTFKEGHHLSSFPLSNNPLLFLAEYYQGHKTKHQYRARERLCQLRRC